MLAPHLLCLLLDCSSPCLDQSIFDWSDSVERKHRSRLDRTRNRLFPRLKHFIEFPPDRLTDRCICVHERLIQCIAKEEGIWTSDIFDDGIKYI